jgi:hypothetical protein
MQGRALRFPAMEVRGDYSKNGYAHLEALIARPVANELLAQLKTSLDQSGVPLQGFMREATMLKRPALEIYGYQHKAMMAFLWGLTPTMCELTKRALLPTYSYFRVYQAGDVCWVHSDRFACEHSLSLTLAYSDAKPWSFEIGREPIKVVGAVETTFGDDAYAEVSMQPGDAVLYKGVHHRHGRVTPNPNRWSAHMFLHWVDAEGPWRDEAFDRKPAAQAVDFVLN